MKKYIKAFQTINNGTGGTFGLKKIKGTVGMANTMGILEGYKKVTVIGYSGSTTSIIKNNNSSLDLRKKNTNSFLSKKQLRCYSWSKKKHMYLYKNKMVFVASGNNFHGARVFGKNK